MRRSPHGLCNRCGLTLCHRATRSGSPSSTRRTQTRRLAAPQTARAARQRRWFQARAEEAQAAKAASHTSRPTRNPHRHPHLPHRLKRPSPHAKPCRWTFRHHCPMPQLLCVLVAYRVRLASMLRALAHVQTRCHNPTPLLHSVTSTQLRVCEMNNKMAPPLQECLELLRH